MNFAPAEPAKRTRSGGVGRKSLPNPFDEVVAEIANKTHKIGDKDVPDARTGPIVHGTDEESVKTGRVRIKRQLADAGKKVTPPVTIFTDFKPANKTKTVKGETVVTEYADTLTFWWGPKITNTSDRRKSATASTPESVAIAK